MTPYQRDNYQFIYLLTIILLCALSPPALSVFEPGQKCEYSDEYYMEVYSAKDEEEQAFITVFTKKNDDTKEALGFYVKSEKTLLGSEKSTQQLQQLKIGSDNEGENQQQSEFSFYSPEMINLTLHILDQYHQHSWPLQLRLKMELPKNLPPNCTIINALDLVAELQSQEYPIKLLDNIKVVPDKNNVEDDQKAHWLATFETASENKFQSWKAAGENNFKIQ